MAKIWEVDFTKRIGDTGAKFEANVGPDLTTDVNISPVTTLPGFEQRPGVRIIRGDSIRNYYDLSGIPEAMFVSPYERRSFVIWAYFPETSTSGATYLWGNGTSNLSPNNGLSKVNALIVLRRAGNNSITGTTGTGWHLITVTNDRSGNTCLLYINGSLMGNTTAIETPPFNHGIIGHISDSQESDFSLGYVATYDHILTEAEIQGIYDAFLVDRLVAEPAGLLSGVVYDYYDNPVPEADVFLVFNDNPRAITYTQADETGYYEIDMPYFGHYTLSSSKPSSAVGARALSLTLSGTPGDGKIIIHDGKETEL